MQGSAISRRLEEQLEPLPEQTVASCELAGLGIDIVAGEELIYARGFGVCHLETREPVTADSLFHSACRSGRGRSAVPGSRAWPLGARMAFGGLVPIGPVAGNVPNLACSVSSAMVCYTGRKEMRGDWSENDTTKS